ncbi:MAG: hypothetical protein ACTSQJ_00300 [Promethearchaeota archaeon]
MTNIGVIEQFLPADRINTINQIIEDYQVKAQKVMNKPYITAHRDLYPKDSPIGAATQNWSNTFNASSTEKVCGVTGVTKIDSAQAVLILGWYTTADFGNDSRFYIKINDSIKSNVNARTVYTQPGHFLITPKLLAFAKENDDIEINVENALTIDVDAIVFPIAILYGEPSILGVD